MTTTNEANEARDGKPEAQRPFWKWVCDLAKAGRSREAIAACESAIAANPDAQRCRLKLGDLQRQVGDIAAAVDSYEKVGERYRAAGDLRKAIAVYKHIRDIVALHADEVGASYGHVAIDLAECYVSVGLESDALAIYEELAMREYTLGQLRSAAVLYRRLRTLDPTNPVVSIRLAECLLELGETDGALALFAHAAGRLRELGKLDEALLVFERLLTLRPDPSYARLAAELHLQRGGERDPIEALRKLQTCVARDPLNLATLELLARAFDAVGKRDKATTVLIEAARIASERGQDSDCSALLQVLAERNPERDTVRRLGRSRRATGVRRRLPVKTADIRGDISEVIRRGDERSPPPSLDEDALWVADNLAGRGEFAEARMILEQVSRAAPDHPLVCEALERLEALEQQAREGSIEVVPDSCPLPSSRREAPVSVAGMMR